MPVCDRGTEHEGGDGVSCMDGIGALAGSLEHWWCRRTVGAEGAGTNDVEVAAGR
jgi:hypothetical protein